MFIKLIEIKMNYLINFHSFPNISYAKLYEKIKLNYSLTFSFIRPVIKEKTLNQLLLFRILTEYVSNYMHLVDTQL